MSTISNPPGQAQLAYRARTYASSLAAMQGNLRTFAIPSGPNAGSRPLAALTTRAGDDPTIAFLDAWAIVIDVLAFYQERIANEGYLRTATERMSLIELAGALGYQLNPGVAATTALAFVIENAVGTPGNAVIPAGTQVQSVPAQNQLPQVFETTAAISARAAWPALRPRPAPPQRLPSGSGSTTPATTLTLSGTNLALQPGALLWVAGQNAAVHVAQASVDLVAGTTTVQLFANETVQLAAIPPLPTTLAPVTPGTLPLLTPGDVETWILGYAWPAPELDTFLRQAGWDPDTVADLVAAITTPAASDTVLAFGQQSGFFGRTSVSLAPPSWGTTASTTITTAAGATTVSTTTTPTASGSATTGTIGGTSTGTIGGTSTSTSGTGASGGGASSVWQSAGPPGTVLLERSVPGIGTGTTMVLVDTTPKTTLHPTGYTLESVADQLVTFPNGPSSQVTGLAVSGAGAPAFPVAGTVAYLQSRPLTLAATVPLDPPSPGISGDGLVLDHMALGLEPGQLVALTGQRLDPATGLHMDPAGVTQTEVLALSTVEHAGGYTTLTFATPLQSSYDTSTVTINANVAPATHGQTVAGEVLGSGDGSQEDQTFVLAKPNLTYVPAATASGGADTLAVSVNDVLWSEVPSLFGQGGQSRTYMIRTDDQGKTSVIFGDGESGARVPTGQENVTATYRTGLGPAGNVAAGALTLLFNRPLGVRTVQNPLPASGGVAPEALDDARAGAPLTVRTLDRIVTLADYADFASDYAGVGKAQATLLESNGNPIAHLTVAPTGGAALGDPTAFKTGIESAIAALADPSQDSKVDLYNLLYFGVNAKLVIKPGAVAATVIAAAQTAVFAAFGFAARGFAQSVHAAEVIAVLQSVPGVLGLTLTPLTFTDGSGGGSVLVANPARWNPADPTKTLGADLILISPSDTSLKT